jgi:predicted phage terminase large subunit-like protein
MFGARVDLAGRMIYLDDCWRFATVDLAASLKTSADYTVAGAWAISPDGDLILLDGVRDRVEETDHWKIIRPLRERWSLDTVFVESRMFGTTLVYEAARSGVPVQELKADSDKLTRALPATVRADNGRLWLPSETAYPDVKVWVDELVSFPNAAHDDCVDNVAYAARVVAAHWVSQVDTESLNRMVTRSTETAIENAYTSATGTTSGDTNYMELSY